MDLTDEVRTCVECSIEFVFTTNDQRFYGERGWGPPKRCKNCRVAARARIEARAARDVTAFGDEGFRNGPRA